MPIVIFEWVMMALVIIVVTTQIILPAISGTHLFPWFRTRKKLDEIMSVRDKLEEKELDKIKEKLEKKLNK